MFNRLIERLRAPATPEDDAVTRKAIARSEQIIERVKREEPEVRRHLAFVRWTLHENELTPKIRAALREER